MSPTIRDVADLAGVSFQLVSAVLAGKKYARASEGTRKRIFESAEKLGYVPSISARVLKGGESKVFGVLVDSRAPEVTQTLLAEIEHEADLHGYRLLVAQAHDNPEKLLKSYYSLKQYGVDGIISLAHDYPSLSSDLEKKLREEKNLVFVMNTSEGERCTVDVDIEDAMKQAVEHLKENGYKKPALVISGKNRASLSASCRRRVEGFCKYAPEGKVIFVPLHDNDPGKAVGFFRDIAEKTAVSKEIDSFISMNDYFASLLMKELLKCGVRIGQDVGLIGWDNLFIGECTPVTLTTFYYDRSELAKEILSMLFSRIRREEDDFIQKKCFKLKMIVRESTQKNILDI